MIYRHKIPNFTFSLCAWQITKVGTKNKKKMSTPLDSYTKKSTLREEIPSTFVSVRNVGLVVDSIQIVFCWIQSPRFVNSK